MNRREFLLNSTKTMFGTAALASFPLSIQKALAIDAKVESGTIQDVKHIVILTQENRSFDNYFGTLKGVRGFGDRFTIPMTEGRKVWEQYDANKKKVLPYHLDSRLGNAQRVSGTPHSWSDGQAAWDNGRMSDWVAHKQPQSMGYYKKQEVEYQFALANAFTICDAYHCAMHAGTNPNRKFIWTGTNGPTGAGVASVVNEFDGIGPSTEGYEWTTYPERLQQAGVTWKVYQNMPDNFTDNPLAGFKQYRRANEQSGQPVSNDTLICPAYDEKIDATQPLYKGIANTMPDGGFLGAFKADIAQGKLPQVSWLVAPATYSEHPGPSSPVQGAWYIQEVLNALTENSQVWSQTVLLVNFDENDGFFDHVPSPSAPSKDINGVVYGKTTLTDQQVSYEYFNHPAVATSKSQPETDGRVYGPGVRVPMYVISPWSRGGWVNSQVFDHTSILQFLEKRFGVQEPNISPYRRAVCGDLTTAFNFKTPNLLPVAELDGKKTKAEADAIRVAQELLPQVSVPSQQQFPQQEIGIRPSRALPYILHTSAKVDATQKTVKLMFSNTGKQAAVFHVYNRLDLTAIPRRYMVEAGKQLDDVWNTINGQYDLWVLGPNGFHRAFKGNLSQANQTQALPEIRVCVEECDANLYLKVRHDGNKSVKLNVKANAYLPNKTWAIETNSSEKELVWDMSEFGGWYDFTVTLADDATFNRRFAGRIETQEDSISDPYMGYLES
ncbi:phosphocholine-specific phospholipase C [Acinetobacter baumannii]|uniref:phosphocholine-specific phospholipase C n=1 Tax=Acinetobacter baumannii TaxID=470 RepID=UPI0007EAE898|nr:phospholipase C, phosphocholine-specific [Acinetobacter baumannii]MBD0459684.1 phospholipase C, phosphocholine-specific [Acinetobacter baumannii]MBD0536178.1 phospholipase C, phosphocholine-specific [Acinetobacter baumannii]MCE6096956.1 phospholipase C, phosphocholine-specific [Acinetobacter baumannii]MCE6217304.1 phospholipase C, phosphocholine-specific [Acinetobacter baumannii]MCE6386856.1 phospholipase C, phosphocholine-specific [Acinetobacter baumannii]